MSGILTAPRLGSNLQQWMLETIAFNYSYRPLQSLLEQSYLFGPSLLVCWLVRGVLTPQGTCPTSLLIKFQPEAHFNDLTFKKEVLNGNSKERTCITMGNDLLITLPSVQPEEPGTIQQQLQNYIHYSLLP